MDFLELKAIMLNTMLYKCKNENYDVMLVNEFQEIKEQRNIKLEGKANDTEKETINNTTNEVAQTDDSTYFRWEIFDEIPERVYNIQCECYVDTNAQPLNDETSIKHLINGKRTIYIDASNTYDEFGNPLNNTMYYKNVISDNDDYCYY